MSNFEAVLRRRGLLQSPGQGGFAPIASAPTAPASSVYAVTSPAPLAQPAQLQRPQAPRPPAPEPEPTPAPSKRATYPSQQTAGARKGTAIRAGMLPPGTQMRQRSQVPTISPEVARHLDRFTSYDQIQSEIAQLRRTAQLYGRGYTKSAQTRIVVPPNWSGMAITAGAIPPQQNIAPVSGSTSNASEAYDAEGGSGRQIPNPQFEVPFALSRATAPPPGSQAAQTAVAVQTKAVGGRGATSQAADSGAASSQAVIIGASVAAEAAAPPPTFRGASIGLANMFANQ